MKKHITECSLTFTFGTCLATIPALSYSLPSSPPIYTETEWASVQQGVFICMICAGIHRHLNYRVLSIRLDQWTEELYKVRGRRKSVVSLGTLGSGV